MPEQPNNDQKAELLKRWVEALRSGKYEQVQGMLHVDHGFCCLGVLCDLSGAGQWIDGRYVMPGEDAEWGALTLPPTEVSGTVDLTVTTANYYASMNDNGATFAEIAERIEQDNPDVFGVPAHA